MCAAGASMADRNEREYFTFMNGAHDGCTTMDLPARVATVERGMCYE